MAQTRYGDGQIPGGLPAYGRSKLNVIRLISVILVLLSGTAYGQLMKCVDKAGKVEYANACPAGTKQEQIGIKSGPGSAAPAAAPQKSLGERDAEFRKRQIEQQESQAKQDKKTAEDQRRQRACEQARSYLKSLEDRNRIVRTDPNTGERAFLEDADYAKETAVAQSSVNANCQ
jgi:hypothetical protein